MAERMQDLAMEIVRLQGELDREIEKRRKALGIELHDRVVEFEHGLVVQHRRLRTDLGRFVSRSTAATVLTAPIIYSMVLPMLLMDLWASAYQAVCFRAYRVPRVSRRDYIVFDRRRLAYLNWIEAVNCVFCGYANGVVGYVREIGSRTEQYWCPIKHALRITDPHQRYYEFLEYGDAEGYRARLTAFREALRANGGDAVAPQAP